MTEIYDYLRLSHARAGKTISPISGKEVKKDEVIDVVNAIKEQIAGTKVVISCPLSNTPKEKSGKNYRF
jgi:excinuclease ABC subunit A